MVFSKLTDTVIMLCRQRYIKGHPIHGASALGREFGVHAGAISAAVRGITWKHVGGLK